MDVNWYVVETLVDEELHQARPHARRRIHFACLRRDCSLCPEPSHIVIIGPEEVAGLMTGTLGFD